MVINMEKAKLRTVAQLQEFLDETQEINPGSGQYAHRLSLERLHGVIKIKKQQIILLEQRLERVHFFTLAA